jgi:uncharacterized membrane-anchored protein YhcB (DUF1043 family)
MDTLWPILSHPFTWGLALGLLIAGFILKNAFTSKAHLNREIKRLKDDLDQLQKHLNTHLKITASGNDRLEKDLASLKDQNENLRVNIAALQQRPGRVGASRPAGHRRSGRRGERTIQAHSKGTPQLKLFLSRSRG